MSPTVYVLLNDSLKMGKGKIAAQVGHGVAQMVRVLEKRPTKEYKAWSGGVEAIVVLKAGESVLRDFAERSRSHAVYDAGKTQVQDGSLTVVVCEPLFDGRIPDIFKRLKLA